MATDISPPSRGGLPWPAPNEDHQLLELKLEWNGLDDAQERIAGAVRPFLLTRDPLAWIPQRGSAWATANADGDTLELPVYVLYEEAERRLQRIEASRTWRTLKRIRALMPRRRIKP